VLVVRSPILRGIVGQGKPIMIVVTGGCGFIGSEVVRQLLERGYAVRVLDDLSKPESTRGEGYEFVQVDLTDPAATLPTFSGAEVCINLAAKIGGIGYFHRFPATILSENNKLYSSTFEAAVRHKLRRMVYVSSSMVFESASSFPSLERDVASIPPPITSYGFSKLSGEWYCRAFAAEHGLPYTILRPFNAYGINEAPGDEVGYAHVIPDLVKKVLQGQDPLELLGSGEQTRCFTHVRDIARGIIMAMESERAIDEDFNLGTSLEVKILDLARTIFDHCRTGRPFRVRFVEGFEHDIKRRVPDAGKAAGLFGWKPEVPFEKGLIEVIEWIKARGLDAGDRR
jgi:nucleoside-diphosphate-sugar epimerase